MVFTLQHPDTDFLKLAAVAYVVPTHAVARNGADWAKPPQIVVIDGRPRGEEDDGRSTLGRMLHQLTTAIRGSVERTIIVLLHLDVLTTTHTSLTMEAREAIPLLYENPEAVLLGFRDPSFSLPRVIEGVFAVRREIVGVPRESLTKLITQREARTLDAEQFDPFALYKYVSGLNPVRLRRLLAFVRPAETPYGDLLAAFAMPRARLGPEQRYQHARPQAVHEGDSLACRRRRCQFSPPTKRRRSYRTGARSKTTLSASACRRS